MAFPSDTLTQSFVTELLEGGHDFQVAGHVFNIALYDDTTTMTAATATYPGAGVNGELAAAGNYTQGGQALTNVAPVWSSTGAVCRVSTRMGRWSERRRLLRWLRPPRCCGVRR